MSQSLELPNEIQLPTTGAFDPSLKKKKKRRRSIKSLTFSQQFIIGKLLLF